MPSWFDYLFGGQNVQPNAAQQTSADHQAFLQRLRAGDPTALRLMQQQTAGPRMPPPGLPPPPAMPQQPSSPYGPLSGMPAGAPAPAASLPNTSGPQMPPGPASPYQNAMPNVPLGVNGPGGPGGGTATGQPGSGTPYQNVMPNTGIASLQQPARPPSPTPQPRQMATPPVIDVSDTGSGSPARQASTPDSFATTYPNSGQSGQVANSTQQPGDNVKSDPNDPFGSWKAANVIPTRTKDDVITPSASGPPSGGMVGQGRTNPSVAPVNPTGRVHYVPPAPTTSGPASLSRTGQPMTSPDANTPVKTTSRTGAPMQQTIIPPHSLTPATTAAPATPDTADASGATTTGDPRQWRYVTTPSGTRVPVAATPGAEGTPGAAAPGQPAAPGTPATKGGTTSDPNNIDKPYAPPVDTTTTGSGDMLSQIKANKAIIDSIYPQMNFNTQAQADADAYSKQRLQKDKDLAQLALFSGITYGAGGNWEGIGKGLGEAGKIYGEGFDRYAQALQAKATRMNDLAKEQYKDATARGDAAMKMYTDQQTRSLDQQKLIREQFKDRQSQINERYKTRIELLKGNEMTPTNQAEVDKQMRNWQKSAQLGYDVSVYDVGDQNNPTPGQATVSAP